MQCNKDLLISGVVEVYCLRQSNKEEPEEGREEVDHEDVPERRTGVPQLEEERRGEERRRREEERGFHN